MDKLNRPEYEGGLHPALKRDEFIIITAAIARLYDALCKWMDALRSGCAVYGDPRIGKSSAIDALILLIERNFQSISAFKYNMQEHQIQTEKEFFRNILTSFGHARANKGNAGEKFDTIVDFLTEEAYKDSLRRLVIFIDEAQWLTDQQYRYLRGIYNTIHDRGVVPLFVLVGDFGLFEKYDQFKVSHREITGRFMRNLYNFRGILSEEEVRIALNCYDTTTDGGCPFSRYFFTTAFDDGWCLASESKVVWETFCKLDKHEDKEIYMSDFVPVVQYILRNFSDINAKSPMLVWDRWEEAFLSTGVGKET